MVVTIDILNEYERVLFELAKKYNFSNHGRIIELVKLNAELVSPVSFARPVCRDKDDDKFLSAALVGKVPIIVSGDLDLHAVDGFKGIRVMTPKSFLSEFC